MKYTDKLKAEVRVIGDGWKQSAYYDNVERTIPAFWGEHSFFKNCFDRLDLGHVVELACGHGRHAEQIKDAAGKISLMDVNQENIDYCKERFKGLQNVAYFTNNGLDFTPLEDNSASSIFCYDAMVHFDHRCVLSYLEDARRILVPGGMALFHHSNNSYPFSTHYGQNPHSRNFMTKELFARYSLDSGLEVIDQFVFDWGSGEKLVKNLDCLTLVRKKA
ncbi:MAG: class I SAM-dependent methyltransferase [Parvularculaceae bacterium]